MTIVVRTPGGYEAERRYVLDVVLGEFLGLQYEHVVEERDDVDVAGVRLPDGLFAMPEEQWLKAPVTPELADVLGTCFFMLTRYEEAVPGERDAHGRFPASASFAARHGLLERAIVNELVEQLWTQLERELPRLRRNPRSFRMLPSHDVDVPFSPASLARRARLAAVDVVKRRDVRLATRRFVGDPFDTFDWLMDESEQNGVRSAFYFLAAHTGPADGSRPYSLDDPRVRDLLGRIHARGHEVGVHGSYETWRDPARLAREADAVRAAAGTSSLGGRQHYLRWANPDTWRGYEEAGLAYDTTLTFADAPGFRCGVCWEFPVFDLAARRTLTLRERPLVAMEASLLQYQGLDHEATRTKLIALKDTCRRHDGDFTLLWHNDRLWWRGAQDLYRDVLAA
jgi:hypothetical protein